MEQNPGKREPQTSDTQPHQPPVRKRVKLVVAEPAASAEDLKVADPDASALPCDANECVELRLVRAAGKYSKFNPKFTHQLFGDDEQIEGYTDPKMVISYSADFQSCMLDMSWTSKQTEAEDLREKLEPALPAKLLSASDFSASLQTPLRQPPGEKLCGYTRNIDGTESAFEVYRCDLRDPLMQAIYTNIETLPLLFIDGGSTIDFDDHRWQIFCSYERYLSHESHAYALVSYASVFRFNTLFRQGVCSTADSAIIRVCQMLVLPPFQKAGHGVKLLKEVYRYAHNDPAITEITVRARKTVMWPDVVAVVVAAGRGPLPNFPVHAGSAGLPASPRIYGESRCRVAAATRRRRRNPR
jgi:histone acetyltransferase 1